MVCSFVYSLFCSYLLHTLYGLLFHMLLLVSMPTISSPTSSFSQLHPTSISKESPITDLSMALVTCLASCFLEISSEVLAMDGEFL